MIFLIGYAAKGSAILPMLVIQVGSVKQAREVAADVRSKPGPRVLFFDFEQDGRTTPLKESA